jgi:hypothetical protein
MFPVWKMPILKVTNFWCCSDLQSDKSGTVSLSYDECKIVHLTVSNLKNGGLEMRHAESWEP